MPLLERARQDLSQHVAGRAGDHPPADVENRDSAAMADTDFESAGPRRPLPISHSAFPFFGTIQCTSLAAGAGTAQPISILRPVHVRCSGRHMPVIGLRVNQCQRPTGWLGRFVLWSMNRSHSGVTDWGLSHVSIGPRDTVLDVGCGGGRTVGKLAVLAREGKVYGADLSKESVAAARRTNRAAGAAGRVEIREAPVSALPFPDGIFDTVTAVETHFWWDDLPGGMREIRRVLKRGGALVVIAEIYRGATTKTAQLAGKYLPLSGMKLLTPEEHRTLFVDTGYADVRVTTEPRKGWICAIGRTPDGAADAGQR